MSAMRVCIALAFDSVMFHQGRECIRLLRSHDPANQWAIHVLDLGLTVEQITYLREQGVTLCDARAVPNFPDAPAYARAMTCRPYLRQLCPGYDIYMWIDADIRVLHRAAMDLYLNNAGENPTAIVICQEVEQTYVFVRDPTVAALYHRLKNQRIQEVYGLQMAEKLSGFICYNAGIFALHRDSLIWDKYRANLERALQTSYHHMKEQDAMNVAIVECGMSVLTTPATMNWLCSCSLPIYSGESRQWARPVLPHVEISVLHLTNSSELVDMNGEKMTWYEIYKKRGMTR